MVLPNTDEMMNGVVELPSNLVENKVICEFGVKFICYGDIFEFYELVHVVFCRAAD